MQLHLFTVIMYVYIYLFIYLLPVHILLTLFESVTCPMPSIWVYLFQWALAQLLAVGTVPVCLSMEAHMVFFVFTLKLYVEFK
jgi:hypothetical protein